MSRFALLSASLLWVLAGCTAPGPATPSPTASPAAVSWPARPPGAAAFGAIQAVSIVPDVTQLIVRDDEDPAAKTYGLATSYRVGVDGVDYSIIWNQAEAVRALEAGQTVNLHPSEYSTYLQQPGQAPRCERLYRVYRGSRRVDPIQAF